MDEFYINDVEKKIAQGCESFGVSDVRRIIAEIDLLRIERDDYRDEVAFLMQTRFEFGVCAILSYVGSPEKESLLLDGVLGAKPGPAMKYWELDMGSRKIIFTDKAERWVDTENGQVLEVFQSEWGWAEDLEGD